jgi:hypothetical protein
MVENRDVDQLRTSSAESVGSQATNGISAQQRGNPSA